MLLVALSSILCFMGTVRACGFPVGEPAPNLQVERQLGLRPYFLEVEASSILGWRKDGDSPLAPINQIRINEYSPSH